VSSPPPKPLRIGACRTAAELRAHGAALGLDLPCDDAILTGADSPLNQPIDEVRINGKRIGNRYAIQPMEGWDGTALGGVTPEVTRRWTRFGHSGAKLIWGGEAMAVRPDGRANPNQLVIDARNQPALARLLQTLRAEHQQRFGTTDDLVVGFQLTHSGRFCRPNDKRRLEPWVAYRHPILERRFDGVTDARVLEDAEVERLIEDFARAARIAAEAGADFVDIKHCHGYLLHEFLSAFERPGPYGGSFENRTRILREIVAAIRGSGNPIAIGVRLSAFDFVPFRPDPALSRPGKPGSGIPEECADLLPYRYGFGVNPQLPTEPDLTEAGRFLQLCAELGIRLVNLTAGSPYYNPHIQRPAAYPPSDGYWPPEDPLVGVARQINAVRTLKRQTPPTMVLVGTAYSYLQEYLPHVAQAVVRARWADAIGLGRAVLSYPDVLWEATQGKALDGRRICRTFSDCTTAPRNGLISGCYPLDEYYAHRPEAGALKQLKRGTRVGAPTK
jgi:2,4-dienoyl-CoA reductase-like NADH-dependent reductase (Old Yellow Enzyme family)